MIAITITIAATFWSREFRYFPMISSLFKRRIKNTSAAGSRVTAITCTKSVIRTSGAFGIRTTAPALMSAKK